MYVVHFKPNPLIAANNLTAQECAQDAYKIPNYRSLFYGTTILCRVELATGISFSPYNLTDQNAVQVGQPVCIFSTRFLMYFTHFKDYFFDFFHV